MAGGRGPTLAAEFPLAAPEAVGKVGLRSLFIVAGVCWGHVFGTRFSSIQRGSN